MSEAGERPLFLHEFIDIVGQHQWDYMEHAKAQAGHEKVDFELFGTWYTMGITGRWPQVVNVWDIPGGWDGWEAKVDRLGMKRMSNQHLEGWWDTAYTYRTGGVDRLLAGAPGCPTSASLAADGVRTSLFVHELTEVRPGAALDYLAAVREVRVPLLAEYGHQLVGLWEVMMTDTEVCTVWATEAADHARMGKARDVARGVLGRSVAGVDGDDRIEAWHVRAREFTVRWREELMTPAPGTLLAPKEVPVDDSVSETGPSAPPIVSAAMRAWRIHEYGQPLDVLQLDDAPLPEPEAGEVRVKVQAIPLNLNDLERINGGNMMVRPEFPYSPGMEVMGVVDACGPGTEDWLGARVVAMPKGAHGGYAEYAICPAVSTFAMPESIPLPDAAALYFPFHLAWLGLIDRAELEAGESVLIHAAAGGSGSAAVQLAKHAGARVFATAGSAEKVALCRELGADFAIDYVDDDFAAVVMRETDNRGVDVVFDNVGDAVFDASVKCTAYNGRYVMMGFASDKTKADEPYFVPRQIMAGNIKLCGVLLAYAQPEIAAFVKQAMGFNFVDRASGERIMESVVDLVLKGAVKPVIGSVVDFNDLPAAIDAMAKRETTGRTIILV